MKIQIVLVALLLDTFRVTAFPVLSTEDSGSGDCDLGSGSTEPDFQVRPALFSSNFAVYFMGGTGGVVLLFLFYMVVRDREGPCNCLSFGLLGMSKKKIHRGNLQGHRGRETAV